MAFTYYFSFLMPKKEDKLHTYARLLTCCTCHNGAKLILEFYLDFYPFRFPRFNRICSQIFPDFLSLLKFLGQLIIGALTLYILIKFSDHEYLYNLYFPFFKNLIWQMGIFFIPFGLFVIIGSSNAVNLTDGLDGLATVPVMLVALSFMLISYVVGNTIFSEYLQLQYIPDVGEISIFCGASRTPQLIYSLAIIDL